MSDVRFVNRLEIDAGLSLAGLRRATAAAFLALLVTFAILVLARRAVGALERPLDSGVLLLAGAVIAAIAVAIRAAWFARSAMPVARWQDRSIMLATLASVVVLFLGLCISGTPIIACLLLFTILAGEEAWSWHRYLKMPVEWQVGNLPRGSANTDRRSGVSPLLAGMRRDAASTKGDQRQNADLPPKEVVQQLTRRIDADGAETLSGWLRMPFAIGQRTANVHVAFCPPMRVAPEVSVEQIEGPAARIKTAQLLPYGARLDLKLAAAAEAPTDVLLLFSARAK
jgi:hypothetical protein